MKNIYFISYNNRTIEGQEYYSICVLDKNNLQLFTFYHKVDDKAKNFLSTVKCFDDISDRLTFVIKRNNKISFDLK